MKRIFVLLFCFLFVSTSFAQKQGNVWVFGDGAGLNFNGGDPPVPITSNFSRYGSCASICDANGTLLFYTDGYKIWDVYNNVMPHGTSTVVLGYYNGGYSSSSSCIVQDPGHDGRYYIFSLSNDLNAMNNQPNDTTGRGANLRYTVVDMSLHNGSGDVDTTQKDILIDSNFAYSKLIPIAGNDCNAWLVTRSLRNNQYESYEITASGINSTPVLSNCGLFTSKRYEIGALKMAPSRTKLAAICYIDGTIAYLTGDTLSGVGGIETYDFDPATGKLSNAMIIDSAATNNGVGYNSSTGYIALCFSEDGSKLYASTDSTYTSLVLNDYLYAYVQFDLSLGTNAAIAASRTFVGGGEGADLKRGPDGIIYFPGRWFGYQIGGLYGIWWDLNLFTIDSPNYAGAACQFDYQPFGSSPSTSFVLALGTDGLATNFPNEIVAFPIDTVHNVINTYICADASMITVQADTPGWAYQWDNGTKSSSRILFEPGKYTVHYRTPCTYHIDTFVVSPAQLPSVGTNAGSCLYSRQGAAWAVLSTNDTIKYNYTWTDSAGDTLRNSINVATDTLKDLFPGVYTMYVQLPLGCDTVIKFTIDTFPQPTASFSVDSFVCGLVPVNFNNTSIGATAWLWTFGDGDSSTSQSPAHTYGAVNDYQVMLIAEGANCNDTLTKHVSVRDFQVQLSASNNDVRLNGAVTLQSSSSAPYHVLSWLPAWLFTDQSAVDQTVNVDSVRNYTVIAQGDNGCIDSATVMVDINTTLFMADAFSPNGDGLNDYFHPHVLGTNYQILLFQVYNRWGQLVFDGTGTFGEKGWDGTFHGQAADVGVYFYKISIATEDGKIISTKGDVTLVR